MSSTRTPSAPPSRSASTCRDPNGAPTRKTRPEPALHLLASENRGAIRVRREREPPAHHQPRDCGRHPHVVERRGEEARDDQLPHAQAGEGRALLREDLRSDEGLGVLLRQVQARALQGHHLRALWRRGHALEGAARADGPHPARRARHAHLVLQGCPEPARLPARHRAEVAREGHLLRRALDHVGRHRASAQGPAVARGRDEGRDGRRSSASAR